MTIRPNTLLVSWYEGVYHKVSVEWEIGESPKTGLHESFCGGRKDGLKYGCGRYPL